MTHETRKRKMTPTVDHMTIRDERQCLKEIRANAHITPLTVLSNGLTLLQVATNFTLGQHIKRHHKSQRMCQRRQLNRVDSLALMPPDTEVAATDGVDVDAYVLMRPFGVRA
jgi:hypothetical protein